MLSALLAASVTYGVPAATACPDTDPKCLTSSITPSVQFASPAAGGGVCQFTSATDVTGSGSAQTGEISGGPLVTLDVDTFNPRATGLESGTLSCYLLIDSSTPTGPAGHPGVTGHGSGVVTAGPAQVTYDAYLTQNVYLCAEWRDDADGTTYYYDDATGNFTDSPTPCSLTFAASTPDNGPVEGLEKSYLDPVICPVQAKLGIVVWECPPYH
jgi:hypothetical protein